LFLRYVDGMRWFSLLSQCLLTSATSISIAPSPGRRQGPIGFANALKGPVVETTNGSVSGIFLHAYNQDAFLAIPFAAPPVGSLRFRAPQPLRNGWDGIRPARTYGPACAQWGTQVTDRREDCLTLNSMLYSSDTIFEPQKAKFNLLQLCDLPMSPPMPNFRLS
jgi:hypothetical protein